MAVNGIEIKVGQKWNTRNAGVAEVVNVSSIDGLTHPVEAVVQCVPRSFKKDGCWSAEGEASEFDFITLASECKDYQPRDTESSHESIINQVVMDVPGYEKLAAVLQAAYNQAAIGKGRERHANNKPFHEQPMCAISRNLGSIDGLLYQATKKPQEARGLPTRARALAEIYGAINYLAGAAILIEEGIIKEQE